MSLVEDFAELFSGNPEAHGTDAGGCVREPPDYAAHLAGTPIGIYFAWQGQCKMGMVDFDIRSEGHVSYDFETEDEAHVAAVNLRRAFDGFGVMSWVERTRSHGRHIWCFAHDWVTLRVMRRALIVACEITDAPIREVNPKAETLPEGKLGNYARICYPGGGCALTQSCMGDWYDSFSPVGVEFFVRQALATRAHPSTLQMMAHLYSAPEKVVDWEIQSWDRAGTALNARGIHIWEQGPLDGDRSRGLSYLARQCFLSGLDPETALMVLGSCEWQKFRGRADEERRLKELIEGAYG